MTGDLKALVDVLQSIVLPFVVSIVTVLIVHWFQLKRMKIEQDEKLIRELFNRRADALSETYQALSHCYDVLTLYSNSPPTSIKQFNKEVLSVKNKWEETEQKNAIWLSPIEREISDVRAEFRLVSIEISKGVRNPAYRMNVRWQQFSDAFYRARDAIRSMMQISYLEKRLKEFAEVSAPENVRSHKAMLLVRFFWNRICNFRVIILVCLFILILSILAYFAEHIFPGFNQFFLLSSGTPWGIVTSLFIHIETQHLTENIGSLFLFLFYFISTNLCHYETKVRRRAFFASLLIFSSAIFSNLLWILLRPDVSAIGASGLIYALNGATLGFALSNISEVLKMSDIFDAEDIETLLKSKSKEVKRKFLRMFRYTFWLINMGVLMYFLIFLFSSPQQFLNVNPGVNSFVHALSFYISFVFAFVFAMLYARKSRSIGSSASEKDAS